MLNQSDINFFADNIKLHRVVNSDKDTLDSANLQHVLDAVIDWC